MTRALRKLVELLSGLVVALAVCAAADGWLNLAAAWRVPGGNLGDALPLYELSRRSGSAALVFIPTWAVAAVVLGLLARRLRAGRLTAAVSLSVGVGAWCYLTTAVSLSIVRQIGAGAALHAAYGVRAVFVPAVLAGLAGALLGRPRPAGDRVSVGVLAVLVAAVGALGVIDALLPSRSGSLLAQLAPVRVHPLASAVIAPVGLALVVIARGLWRRKRRAWQAGVALLAAMTALHVLHSFDGGALITGLAALALLARRDAYSTRGDPAAVPRLAGRAALLVSGFYLYGIVAIWANRMMSDHGFSVWLAVKETSASIVGMEWNGSAHLTGEFGEWFGTSVFIVAVVGIALLLRAWLAPWRYRLLLPERERRVAHELVSAWGADTLSPFALRADKSYFFSDDERAFLAYRVVGGVAVVSGDPIGFPDALQALVARFIEFAHGRGWRVAVLGASEDRLGLYRAVGLQALYHGDEAVLDVGSFSLDGRPIRKVRQSCSRLAEAGFTSVALYPREIGSELRDCLLEIARSWRGDEPDRGFTMAFDDLFRVEAEDALFVIGLDPEGNSVGFLHFAVSRAGRALSLSTMPRLRTTPNGFNEWLVCEAVTWARGHAVDRISLNFAPFAALLAPEAELRGAQHVQRRALLALKGHFQLDNLLLFNRKFFPGWQRRYIVYESRSDLPRVGIAALVAEAYLPNLRQRRRPALEQGDRPAIVHAPS